jgi:hypothetical protein
MRALWIITFFFIVHAHADQKVGKNISVCELPKKIEKPSTFELVYNILKDRDICTEDIIVDAAKEEYQKYLPKGQKKATLEILGKEFSGNPADLEAFAKMVDPQGYPQNPDLAIKVSNCDDVHCALRELLQSEEAAYLSFAFYHKTGIAPSIAAVSGREYYWNKKELWELHSFMNKVPSFLKDLPTLGYLFHIEKTSLFENATKELAYAVPGFNKNGAIYLTKSFNRLGDSQLKMKTFVHQLVHHYDFEGLLTSPALRSVSTGYAENVGFTYLKDPMDLKYRRRDGENAEKQCFLSPKSRLNSFEDFAVSLTAYVVNPVSFKEQCPEKYVYVKDSFFNGKEYLPTEDNFILDEVKEYLTENTEEFNSCLISVNTEIDARISMQYKVDYHYGRKLYTELSPSQRKLLDTGLEYGFRPECVRNIVTDVILKNNLKMTDVCIQNVHHEITAHTYREVDQMAREQLDEDIRVNIAKINEYSNECLQQKDLSEGCVHQKFAVNLSLKGYDVSKIMTEFNFNHTPMNYDFDKANVNVAAMMIQCFNEKKTPLIDYFSDERTIKENCTDVAYEYLESNGYRLSDKWFINSSNLFKTAQLKTFMATLSEEFLNKSVNDFEDNCPALEEECLRNSLKENIAAHADNLYVDGEMIDDKIVDFFYSNLRKPPAGRFLASEPEEAE